MAAFAGAAFARPNLASALALPGRGRGTTGLGARRGVDGTHLLSVRKRDCHELPATAADTQWMDHGFDFHAGRERLRTPALPRQAGRATHLDGPLYFLTFGIVHHQ